MREEWAPMGGRTVFACVVALALGACAAPSPEDPPELEDPASFCAAVGVADVPSEAGYVGPAVPEWLAHALWRATGGIEDPDEETFSMAYNAEWRCVDGAVLACTYGANLPCASKADPDTTPNTAIRAFCTENPDAEFVPAVATGRETIFAWRCAGAEPRIERRMFSVDARGYAAEFWYAVARDMAGPL
jgi:hypothetical protein